MPFSLSPKCETNSHTHVALCVFFFFFLTRPSIINPHHCVTEIGGMVLFPFYGLRKQGPRICWRRANVKAETWTQAFRVQVECPFRHALLRAQVHANKSDQVTRPNLWYSPSRRVLESTHAIRAILEPGQAWLENTHWTGRRDPEGCFPPARSAPGLGFLISKETTEWRAPKSLQHQAD